jgi:tetratricopeptide (TPR) repeat protein
LVHSFQELGIWESAWDVCNQGLQLYPKDAELLFRKAALLHVKGELGEAEAAYRHLLHSHEERHYSSVVRGIQGFLARQNLAAVYSDMGQWAKAEHELRLVVQEMPRYREGWRGLGESLLRQGKTKEVASIAQQLMGDPCLRAEGHALKSQIAMQRGATHEARQELESAVLAYPADPYVNHAWCRFVFENGDPSEAEQSLLNLVDKNPTDASAFHNLGTVYLRTKRADAAVNAYKTSLQHRPDSAATYLNLGYALQEKGDLARAKQAWREVLRLVPLGGEATEARACLQGP